jgi:endonuclease/exonuclease/phosphatase family metal-dependent hydrolase
MSQERAGHNEELKELTICEYNLENLFISMEYYGGESLEAISEEGWRSCALHQFRSKQKPLSKLFGIQKALETIRPDVLMLTEVGGEDSLHNLNRHFLDDRYRAYFVEGNSRRNIDLGFLVRKDLPLTSEARSNRDTDVEVHTSRGKYTAKFSRDVAELRLYQDKQLQFIFLLAHLKSMLSTENDIQGKDVRTAEANALVGIYQKLRAEFPETPIVVGGDFNTSLSSLELELLKRSDLTNFHDCIGTPSEERVSLIHFEANGTPCPNVLDYLLVSPHLCDRIVKEKSYTYRYKGFYEIVDPLPSSLQERYRLPSDHYPLVLTLRL